MKKVTYTNAMPYIYNPERRGAKYSMDGGKTYKNHGEFCESIAKFHRGLDYLVNPATSYDNGSDIEEIKASVKSSNATLADVFGNTFDNIANIYFNNVHSELFIFVNDINDEITEYLMDKEEFRTFIYEWAVLAVDSGTHLTKIRLKKVSLKMLNWLEEKCA